MMGRERRASRNGRSVRGFSLASFEAKRASAMKLISITLAALVAGSAFVGAANAEPTRLQLAQYGGGYGGGYEEDLFPA